MLEKQTMQACGMWSIGVTDIQYSVLLFRSTKCYVMRRFSSGIAITKKRLASNGFPITTSLQPIDLGLQ